MPTTRLRFVAFMAETGPRAVCAKSVFGVEVQTANDPSANKARTGPVIGDNVSSDSDQEHRSMLAPLNSC
jgi:hypothetical protein